MWKTENYVQWISYVKQKDLADGLISYECEKRRGNISGTSECKAKIKVQDAVVVGFFARTRTCTRLIQM